MLKSKAKNLDFLKKIFNKKKKIIIPDFFYFRKKDYINHKRKIISKIIRFNKVSDLIIRSSATAEDKKNKTLAGKYTSINLGKKNYNNLQNKLDKFVRQFKDNKDEIIIQKKISKVDLAGVIFTSDINFDSPYYLINYDNSGKTNLITSGVKNDKKKQLIIYKYQKKNIRFLNLISVCKILEKKLNNSRLDIEFAQKGNKIFLFQIRYLPLKKRSKYTKKDFNVVIKNMYKKIDKIGIKDSYRNIPNTLLSNMADWNPAEMIGEKPNPLALSLYKELITDDVWRLQRNDYGYQDVFPNVLLFSFAGTPYIDLRTDIKSFLPKNLNKKDIDVITNKYLSAIKKQPTLHDKIEFELIETCHSFNSLVRLKKLFNKRISNHYLNELKKINIQIFKGGYIKKEVNKINSFFDKIEDIDKKNIGHIQKIFFYIKTIKEYGTLPFAGIARMAFISQRILLDLKKNKYISDREYNSFYSSLPLINFEITRDYNKLLKKKIKKSNFINKYGHIRPSTYDINSLSFKENYKNYFSNRSVEMSTILKKNLKFNLKIKLNRLFIKNYKINFNQFLEFAKNSVTYREKAKYIFSKGIDEIFKTLINLGKEIDLKRKELGFLDIKNILNFYSKLEARKLKTALQEEIINNKKEFEILNMIKLPDVIKSKNDIMSFEETFSKINFVTSRTTIGELTEIKLNRKNNFNNKIILIKNADPGYDFIFNYKIKGLITMYGGSNSHMAIRCLELDIPAAIGIGNLKYQSILNSKKVLLDCNKRELYSLDN